MEAVIKHSALNVFVVVAESGSIVEAAERLGRTPSAISMTLRQLEDGIGGSLFEGDRKSKITTLGAHVLSTAKAELLCFDRAVSSMRAFARNQIGRVDIASVPSFSFRYLPKAISSFLDMWPEIELELHDADTATVVSLVEGGQVDFGIGGRPPVSGQLNFEPLKSDRFVVLAPPDHELFRGKTAVELTELPAHRLIRNGASDKISVPQFQTLCLDAKLKVWNVMSLVSLVRAGVGITVLPELSVPSEDFDLLRLPVVHEGREVMRSVGIVNRKRTSMTPAATAFRDHLCSIVAER